MKLRRQLLSGVVGAALLVGTVAVGAAGAADPPWHVRRLPLGGISGSPAPGSTLIPCNQPGPKVVLTASAHLETGCIYRVPFEIRASDVTLDCQGARLYGQGSRGILVAAPTTEALHDVTVRNCNVEGWLNNVRITRDGFKTLPEGGEYEHGFERITVENSRLLRSRGSGIFVDGFVTGVTLQDLEVGLAGSVGIYLEAGSVGTVVQRSWIHDNGYGDVKPEGVPFTLGGKEFRYLSTGREGIAVDGSRDNVITGNRLDRNSAGGIFVYKNCGENVSEPGWWTRRYGSTGNLIEGNVLRFHSTGIWLASRQSENQMFMDCSDTPFHTGPFRRVFHDPATDNVVRANTIRYATWGVRVEDDRNRIEANRFEGTDPSAWAVLVGTKERTLRLGQPVNGVELIGNRSLLPRTQPYGWIHGHTGTLDTGNTAMGAPVGLVEGEQPTINPFLFVISAWPAP